MKTSLKKIAALLTCLSLLVGSFVFNVERVEAADLYFTRFQEDEDKYEVAYDSSKYNIYWVARVSYTLKSQYGSMWRKLDKNDKLGTATIRLYYLEPKKDLDGKYYAISGCKINMDPLIVEGSVVGMSQLAEFGISTPNPSSRICSPTVESLQAQVTNSNYSNKSLTINTAIDFNVKNKKWEVGGNLGISFIPEWGSSTSYSYMVSNVNMTQRTQDGQTGNYASWTYDYKSKDGDAAWNAYLHSSSAVAGQVVYRLKSKPTDSNRKENIPNSLYYNIRFGAGDQINGNVANRLGGSTNRDMSIITGKLSVSY